MKEDSSVHKKIVLPLALLLATLAPTNVPAAGAHDHGPHASGGQARRRAKPKPRTRRRPAKRSQNMRQRQQRQQQQAMYTCPMHLEVRSKAPGVCPKCKMELELVEPTGKAKSE